MKKEIRHKLYAKTYTFPGKWMTDEALDELRTRLTALGRRCLGEVPSYGVYLPLRALYENRIITVVYSKTTDEPVAFAAMVVWPIQLSGSKKIQKVVHLGLVIVDQEYRGKMVMYWAYHRPLFRYYMKRFLKPFWITSTTMEPVIFGSVADNFSRVYPHYLPDQADKPTPGQMQIAETFVREHGHEIGISEHAWLDTTHFIVRNSSLGACRELMHDYEHTSKYRVDACNEYCRQHLHYEKGDEFIQVGRVDFSALLKSLWWFWRRFKKWLYFSG